MAANLADSKAVNLVEDWVGNSVQTLAVLTAVRKVEQTAVHWAAGKVGQMVDQ